MISVFYNVLNYVKLQILTKGIVEIKTIKRVGNRNLRVFIFDISLQLRYRNPFAPTGVEVHIFSNKVLELV